MADENEQQKYLEEFNKYFPESDRESGVIKEIREDLTKIEQISDLEERLQTVRNFLTNHSNKIGNVRISFIKSKAKDRGVGEFDTLHKYEKLVKKLRGIHFELSLEVMKARSKKEQEEQKTPTINQIKSNQIKSNQIKSNQSSVFKQNNLETNSQKPNNSKLYLGIGLGILGGGLVGLVLFLVFRNRKEK